MEAARADELWSFAAPVTDASLIGCPECKEFSPLAAWNESAVYCEDCGEHAAMECPACGERFDHVWGPTFPVMEPSDQTVPGGEV
jgi:hypothetical protein